MSTTGIRPHGPLPLVREQQDEAQLCRLERSKIGRERKSCSIQLFVPCDLILSIAEPLASRWTVKHLDDDRVASHSLIRIVERRGVNPSWDLAILVRYLVSKKLEHGIVDRVALGSDSGLEGHELVQPVPVGARNRWDCELE